MYFADVLSLSNDYFRTNRDERLVYKPPTKLQTLNMFEELSRKSATILGELMKPKMYQEEKDDDSDDDIDIDDDEE